MKQKEQQGDLLPWLNHKDGRAFDSREKVLKYLQLYPRVWHPPTNPHWSHPQILATTKFIYKWLLVVCRLGGEYLRFDLSVGG
jgi:hypothetical protein